MASQKICKLTTEASEPASSDITESKKENINPTNKFGLFSDEDDASSSGVMGKIRRSDIEFDNRVLKRQKPFNMQMADDQV